MQFCDPIPAGHLAECGHTMADCHRLVIDVRVWGSNTTDQRLYWYCSHQYSWVHQPEFAIFEINISIPFNNDIQYDWLNKWNLPFESIMLINFMLITATQYGLWTLNLILLNLSWCWDDAGSSNHFWRKTKTHISYSQYWWPGSLCHQGYMTRWPISTIATSFQIGTQIKQWDIAWWQQAITQTKDSLVPYDMIDPQ